jgi:hypothetical protein
MERTAGFDDSGTQPVSYRRDAPREWAVHLYREPHKPGRQERRALPLPAAPRRCSGNRQPLGSAVRQTAPASDGKKGTADEAGLEPATGWLTAACSTC